MINGSVYIGNRGGIPVIRTSATVGTADVRFSLPNHIFRFLGAKGKIIVELNAAITSGTTGTLPVLIETNGTTLPLVNTTGAAITVSDVATVLYYEILFDKASNVLVLTSSIV